MKSPHGGLRPRTQITYNRGMTTTRIPAQSGCSVCGAPDRDVADSNGTIFCRLHQHLVVGEKTTLYTITTDIPDVVGYLR